MSEILSIALSKTQLEDGSWLIYYDGDNLDLDCGIYYLTLANGAKIWYSELFMVKNVVTTDHPELIKDLFHTPMRFYRNYLQQTYYKTKNLCDIGLINPIDHIIPFIFDVSNNLPVIDLGHITTKIICHDRTSELDLTSELTYINDVANKTLYQTGKLLSGQLFCGVYYLEIVVNGLVYFSEHFKVENVTGVFITNMFLYTESDTPTGFEEIVTEDGTPIIL